MSYRQPTGITLDIEPSLAISAINFMERQQQVRAMRLQCECGLLRRSVRFLTAWMRRA